jgi:hypothetical protein
MDIALAVEEIYPPSSVEGAAQFRSAESYEALVATWSDARPVPTQQALADAWNAVQAKQAVDAQVEGEVVSSALFTMTLDEIGAWAAAQDRAAFQATMAEAFVYLRQRLIRDR